MPPAYIPRSPRRSTKLKAMVDGAATHTRGRVRDMSTSGLFVETGGPALRLGERVAVVPLVGELDGEKLPAEVIRVADGGMGLRFVGLDAHHRQQLRCLLLGETSRPLRRPSTSRTSVPALPANASVVLITDDPTIEVATQPVTASDDGAIEEMAEQLVNLGRNNAALMDEVARLKRQVMVAEAKLAMRHRLEQELFELYETVEELEKANDALVQAIRQLSM